MDYQRVYAKIDLDAMAHNIDLVKKKLPHDVKLMLVVKADAYGHGAAVVATVFEEKADYFAVAEMNEALELRRAGVKKPILILGYTSPRLFETALTSDVSLTMFQSENLKRLSETAVAMGKTAKVHLAVDTGMSRIGFSLTEQDADAAAEAFRCEGIAVEGVFSHFAAADGEDEVSATVQRERFSRFLSMLEARGVSIPLTHLDNSAGIFRFHEYDGMVRLGIGLYGLYPSEAVRALCEEKEILRPAMEVITHISHIKTLPAGCGISYGSTYITDRETKVATVPTGYADGYPRALSSKGEVLIHGKRCPILGRVCMDQMMVDVTSVPEAQIEDRVVLVGRDGEEFISVEEVADAAYSFNYEFVCGIPRRMPRVYLKDGAVYRIVSHLLES